jgi:hypothetical protein
MGPMVLLTVRGRKSGEPRTTPVDLFERSGRNRRPITVVELPPELAGAVLKEVLAIDQFFEFWKRFPFFRRPVLHGSATLNLSWAMWLINSQKVIGLVRRLSANPRCRHQFPDYD